MVARELANRGNKITVIDRRNHIAGNCFDYWKDGVRIHKYGPHIFHTNNKKIFDWLSQYTDWVEYKHKVKAYYNKQYLTLPPNIETKKILGEKLFEVIYKPYTSKMWGIDPSNLDHSILQRVRMTDDNNEFYFPKDKYQFLPKNGYCSLIENILNHSNISINLNCSFHKDMEENYDHIYSSMSIDEYYNYEYGKLPYRTIKFHLKKSDKLQPTSVVNFTDDNAYTRITRWEMFPMHGCGNYVTLEEPQECIDNERFYPIQDKNKINYNLYKKYKKISNSKVTFIGRCGLYSYLDMDKAVSSTLQILNWHTPH